MRRRKINRMKNIMPTQKMNLLQLMHLLLPPKFTLMPSISLLQVVPMPKANDKSQSNYWNEMYFAYGNRKPSYDLWLAKYADILRDSLDIPIIDLGCGFGNDTLYLREQGYQVISCDFSVEALQRLGSFIENPVTKLFDMTKGLPFANESAKIIIADLSLHYFSWQETRNIAADIRRVLQKDGYLLARVNSVRDTNHGAGQGDIIEENFYCIGGRLKRFFNKEQLEELFNKWIFHYCTETTMHRYKNSKVLWEIAVKK